MRGSARCVTYDRDHLSTALADRYTIERELGAGGMATVYLAQGLKHKRTVAVTARPVERRKATP